MGTLISKLETAPPMLVLKLLNQKKAESVSAGLRRVSDDLDFTQAVASLVATSGKLNSIKEALIEAFRRRNSEGHFQTGQSMSVDTLLNERAQSEQDDDYTGEMNNLKKKKRGTTPRNYYNQKGRRLYCYDFQRAACSRRNCKYAHVCSRCEGSHGEQQCPQKPVRPAPDERTDTTNHVSDDATPPHPRKRKDRTRTRS